MMNNSFKIIFLAVALFLSGCSNTNKNVLTELTGTTMGTSYSIKIVSTNNFDKTLLQSSIDSVLENVNLQMSTYIPESEISIFNSSMDTTWHKISSDFASVLLESIKLGKLSNGTLDITIEPIVNLWGFGPEDRPRQIPDKKLIAERLRFIGLDKIKVEITDTSSRIKKSIPELKLDLSSTAKGFGVDKIFRFLSNNGFHNYMVEIGGEVRTKGRNAENKNWQIGISTPDKSGAVEKVLPLKNLAMATSGSYWNYFEENGKRFSHTINPLTGRPITHNLVSVTVIAPSCLLADGAATAIDVLGPDEGLQFAEKLNLAAYLIVRNENGYKIITSKNFNKLFN